MRDCGVQLLLYLSLSLPGGPVAVVQDTPSNEEVSSEHSAQFTPTPGGSPWSATEERSSAHITPTYSISSTLPYQYSVSIDTTTYHRDISSSTTPVQSPIEILSQVKVGSKINNTMSESNGGRQNVKSALGSVDVMVPSLRGMELPPLEPTVSKNRSQVQRLGRTDAPMLNYIFDTYSTLNKHYHRNDRFGGPRIVSQGSTVAVDTQARAELDCKVTTLQDKLVSWVRRKPEDDTLEIITIGQQTFTADLRFSVMYIAPDTWRLVVDPTKPEDSGSYECQLSTHPPLISKHHLVVHPPRVQIVDGGKDRYYERNSTLSLNCVVRHLPGAQVTWLHQQMNLNDDTTRGGVSVKTETTDGGADSTLQVARLTHSDSGLYTCLVRDTLVDTIIVHVLNESLAELHQGSTGTIIYRTALLEQLSLVMSSIIMVMFYKQR